MLIEPSMAINGITCHNYEGKIREVVPVKSINISLPDAMGTYIEEKVATGGYSSVSEYFRELVRQDQKRQAAERLEAMLLEGLNCGNATQMNPDDWEDIHQAVRERIAKHKGSNQG
ncbi:MAG TPA: type II toxin-antitoxin system ParD family antitoxin [Nostoc sp.]|uniref:type II toxin-antitoxin system ParD family antitoxin n=1 Tax=Nostoc sp. TaxID=1180 RepID=UPI002D2B9792|nr:type II toxin-antitoxin system ParD family antitoxin [Nostoc sp.]HYX18110.1 type II toxin-antitoxin system ParD family antitoxin [Nostoc sp.]